MDGKLTPRVTRIRKTVGVVEDYSYSSLFWTLRYGLCPILETKTRQQTKLSESMSNSRKYYRLGIQRGRPPLSKRGIERREGCDGVAGILRGASHATYWDSLNFSSFSRTRPQESGRPQERKSTFMTSSSACRARMSSRMRVSLCLAHFGKARINRG